MSQCKCRNTKTNEYTCDKLKDLANGFELISKAMCDVDNVSSDRYDDMIIMLGTYIKEIKLGIAEREQLQKEQVPSIKSQSEMDTIISYALKTLNDAPISLSYEDYNIDSANKFFTCRKTMKGYGDKYSVKLKVIFSHDDKYVQLTITKRTANSPMFDYKYNVEVTCDDIIQDIQSTFEM